MSEIMDKLCRPPLSPDGLPERVGYAIFIIRALTGKEEYASPTFVRQMADEWLANEERIRTERRPRHESSR